MALDKAALGQRYTCFDCETKFYDLNRPEPTCPSCGTDQREQPDEPATASVPVPEVPAPEPAETKEVEDEDAESQVPSDALDIDDDEDDEDLGLSELGAPDADDEADEF